MGGMFFGARGLFALLFLIVTYLTVTPNPEEMQTGFDIMRWVAACVFGNPDLGDKVAHFTAYGALGASAFWAQLSRRVWSAPLLLAAYGAILEGVQHFGGVRSPEIADALANFMGVLAGFGSAMVLAKLASLRSA